MCVRVCVCVCHEIRYTRIMLVYQRFPYVNVHSGVQTIVETKPSYRMILYIFIPCLSIESIKIPPRLWSVKSPVLPKR